MATVLPRRAPRRRRGRVARTVRIIVLVLFLFDVVYCIHHLWNAETAPPPPAVSIVKIEPPYYNYDSYAGSYATAIGANNWRNIATDIEELPGNPPISQCHTGLRIKLPFPWPLTAHPAVLPDYGHSRDVALVYGIFLAALLGLVWFYIPRR
jgi:hypothetical protein